jgi:hypothetical protein
LRGIELDGDFSVVVDRGSNSGEELMHPLYLYVTVVSIVTCEIRISIVVGGGFGPRSNSNRSLEREDFLRARRYGL